ncbi:MAG TPA: hypothetical protein VN645_08540 [Steroidobacteraceae bacterium]|nr:hypothetical protein [Steroidobacteraceae bacterium]
MYDNSFKNLDHQLGSLELHTRGEELAKGYSPDLTATQEGYVRLIMESEPRCDRKAVVGAYLKAEKYSQDASATPTLVFVMREQNRTSVRQMADHLREFVSFWKGVHPQGGVKEVLILSDIAYLKTLQRRIIVASPEFRAVCQVIDLSCATEPAPAASASKPAHEHARRPETDVLRV